jgi:putative oxidoreductase
MTTAAIVALIVRYGLVLLFLPFSALDKILGFDHAVKQARSVFKPRPIAIMVILIGVFVEVVCTLGVVTGIADRACAFVIAGYCAVTAVLYKQFWAQGDFWSDPDGQGRTLLWDFLKNLSLGAGFLLIVIGTDGAGLAPFLHAPFASSDPYGVHPCSSNSRRARIPTGKAPASWGSTTARFLSAMSRPAGASMRVTG